MAESITVQQKSRLFAVRIVRLYQYLCREKNEYVLSKQLLRTEPVLAPMLQKANVRSAGRTSSLKCISHSRNAMKHCTDLTYFTIQITYLKVNTIRCIPIVWNCTKCSHPSRNPSEKINNDIATLSLL